ncbi:hypothetical protein J4P02_23210 [Pseudomonas sp. NFXW11]|uniref:hypothetical protein n=1 Tax=Pseudomonas sp. NFXW11 TaxID=2819531 RepID=UPI003CF15B7A
MILLQRFLTIMGGLSLLLLIGALLLMDFSPSAPPVLPGHPEARWQGAADGGHFVEITRAEAPYYFVQVRYQSGDLWGEGWVHHPSDAALTPDDVLAFDGDGVIYLQQRKVLAASKAAAR